MYVAKLDVSWFRSPFLRHAFLIETPEQIDKLHRAGVRTAEIDPSRGLDVRDRSRKNDAANQEHSISTAPDTSSAASTSLAQRTEQYAQALQARKQLEQAVSSIFSKLAEQGVIDYQCTTEAVSQITVVAKSLPSSTILMALSQDRGGDRLLTQHALATCTLSLILGHTLGFGPDEVRIIAQAAMLHDIGLSQVPSEIVHGFYSGETQLSERDRTLMESHPRLSILMLERQRLFDERVAEIIGAHHTLLDGSGYPKTISGPFTSMQTRIVMIADRYDELLTGFGGNTPQTPHETLQSLFKEAQNGQLDYEIVSWFIKLFGIYPLHTTVWLNTGELAVVTNLNPDKQHQPVVTITHGMEGNRLQQPFSVDLALQETHSPARSIVAVCDNTASHLQDPFSYTT